MKHLTLLLLASILSISAWALPPQMEADRLLLQARAALDAGDHKTAVESFKKSEALNVQMPETFYFHFGKAYSGLKDWSKAQAAYERYLRQAGTGGKFYREALEGFTQAEQEHKQHEEKLRNCPDEHRQRVESARSTLNNLERRCDNFPENGCMNSFYKTQARTRDAKALAQRLRAAERAWESIRYSNATEWCQSRYQ